jgi:hypothetical protein
MSLPRSRRDERLARGCRRAASPGLFLRGYRVWVYRPILSPKPISTGRSSASCAARPRPSRFGTSRLTAMTSGSTAPLASIFRSEAFAAHRMANTRSTIPPPTISTSYRRNILPALSGAMSHSAILAPTASRNWGGGGWRANARRWRSCGCSICPTAPTAFSILPSARGFLGELRRATEILVEHGLLEECEKRRQ